MITTEQVLDTILTGKFRKSSGFSYFSKTGEFRIEVYWNHGDTFTSNKGFLVKMWDARILKFICKRKLTESEISVYLLRME